jgi:hypothetical protein
MYMQHMHQQALAQQFAAAQQSPHFPIGVHPQYPPFAAPQQPHGLQNPHQNHQKADRRSGGHTRAHTPAPASPLTPQQANPFIHKPTTPTPTVTIPSMFSPAASDPLYSMISAEQKLRERERHLYERSRQESSFNHAAAQKMAPSQPPSFSNSIFNKPDLVSYLDKPTGLGNLSANKNSLTDSFFSSKSRQVSLNRLFSAHFSDRKVK